MDAQSTNLVTGGTGFIGSCLVDELLEHGDSVRVFCRPSTDSSQLPSNISIYPGDIRDTQAVTKALSGIDTIYHCAAAMQGNWSDVKSTTVDGTQNLLAAAAPAKVRKIVYLSSLGLINYSRIPNGTVVSETSPVEQHPERRGAYTKAKKEAEDLVWKFKHEHPEIQVLIVRPGLVYGKQHNRILENAGIRIGRLLLVFGSGNRNLGIIQVNNLAKILVALGKTFESDIAGPIHIVDNEQPTVRQYLELIKSLDIESVYPVFLPIIFWRTLFKSADVLIRLFSRKDSNFSYRFNSNAKVLEYRSAFLDEYPLLKNGISIQDALK